MCNEVRVDELVQQLRRLTHISPRLQNADRLQANFYINKNTLQTKAHKQLTKNNSDVNKNATQKLAVFKNLTMC